MALRAASSTTSSPRDTTWRLGAAAPWLWAFGSLLWFVASAYLTLPLVAAAAPQFLLQPLIWGGAVLGGAMVLARLLFGRWLRISWASLALPLVGLALAGLLEESLHAWALARFETFNWRLVGPTYGLFAVMVGSAAAGFGVLVAPRGASLPPVLVAVGGALLSGVVVAVNLPGLGDGLDSESVVPGMLVAGGGAYTWVVGFISVFVAMHRELPDATMTPHD